MTTFPLVLVTAVCLTLLFAGIAGWLSKTAPPDPSPLLTDFVGTMNKLVLVGAGSIFGLLGGQMLTPPGLG